MNCPSCNADTRVLESRSKPDRIRRRRSCIACGQRFTTWETWPDITPTVTCLQCLHWADRCELGFPDPVDEGLWFAADCASFKGKS
jgi:hypothetical protein